jgi:N utilization substance protein B
MGRRHSARRAALQYHFWRDLHGGEGPETIAEFWELCPAKPNVQLFAQPLIEGMLAHLPEIDERITRYCENYEFRRISAVDRNVLRLGIFEMFYRDDIPPVVPSIASNWLNNRGLIRLLQGIPISKTGFVVAIARSSVNRRAAAGQPKSARHKHAQLHFPVG